MLISSKDFRMQGVRGSEESSCGADHASPTRYTLPEGTRSRHIASPRLAQWFCRFNELGNRSGKIQGFCTSDVWITNRSLSMNVHC